MLNYYQIMHLEKCFSFASTLSKWCSLKGLLKSPEHNRMLTICVMRIIHITNGQRPISEISTSLWALSFRLILAALFQGREPDVAYDCISFIFWGLLLCILFTWTPCQLPRNYALLCKALNHSSNEAQYCTVLSHSLSSKNNMFTGEQMQIWVYLMSRWYNYAVKSI